MYQISIEASKVQVKILGDYSYSISADKCFKKEYKHNRRKPY